MSFSQSTRKVREDLGDKGRGHSHSSNDRSITNRSYSLPATSPDPCKLHPRPITRDDISRIGYGICIGNIRSTCTRFLFENGFSHVLSIGPKPDKLLGELQSLKAGRSSPIQVQHCELSDNAEANIEKVIGSPSVFRFIDEGTLGSNKILIHCTKGWSRSVSVVIAYLKLRKRFTWRQELIYVGLRRPYMCINEAFMAYIRAQQSDIPKPPFEKDNALLLDSEASNKKRAEQNQKALTLMGQKEDFSRIEKDMRVDKELDFKTERMKKK